MAFVGAYGAAGGKQLQLLRAGASWHRQKPHLQGNQPEQHFGVRRSDHGGQSVLQHGRAQGGAGRIVGCGGV